MNCTNKYSTFELEEHHSFPEPPAPARKRESTTKENTQQNSQLASIFAASALQNMQGSVSPQKKSTAPLFQINKDKPSLFGNGGLFPLFENNQSNDDNTNHSTHTNNDESDMEIESSTADIFAATKATIMRSASAEAGEKASNLISLTPPKEDAPYQNIYPSIENFAANLGNSRRASAVNPEDNQEHEMTMDMTGFGDMHLAFQQEQVVEEEEPDQTMDMTQMFGSIKSKVEEEEQYTGKSESILDQLGEVDMVFTSLGASTTVSTKEGGPQSGSNDNDEHSDGEQTMDFTRIGPSTNQNDDDDEVDMDFTTVASKPKDLTAINEEEDMDFTSVAPLKQQNEVNNGEEDMDFTTIPTQSRSLTGTANTGEEDMEFTTVLPSNRGENVDNNEEDMDFTKIVPSSLQFTNGEADMDFTTVMPSQRLGIADLLNTNDGEQEMEFTKVLGRIDANEDEGEVSMDMTRIQPAKFTIFEDSQNKENIDTEKRRLEKPSSAKKSGLTPLRVDAARRTESPSTPTRVSRSQRSSLRSPVSATKQAKRKSYTPGSSGRKRRRVSSTPSPVQQDDIDIPPPMTPSKTKQLEDKIIGMSPKKVSRTPVKPLPPPRGEDSRLLSILDGPVITSYTPLAKMRKDSIGSKGRSSIAPLSPVRGDDTVLSRVSEGDEEEAEEAAEYPAISLSDFLKMITVDFMDGLFMNSTRNQRQHQQEMALVQGGEQDKDSDLIDYASAMAKIPTLELYNFSFQEMRKNITEARDLLSQIDAETLEDTPLLFREFIEAGPDLKQAMITQFKLIKNYARHQARGVWYDWRVQLTQGLKEALVKRMEAVQHDKLLIERKKKEVDVDEIHQRVSEAHAQMKARLETLRQQTTELEQYDREEILAARRQLESVKQEHKGVQDQAEQVSQKVESVNKELQKLDDQKVKLKEQIKECEKIKSDNRRIDIGEILELEQQFNGIQMMTGLKFSKIEGSQVHFILQGMLNLMVDLKSKQLVNLALVKQSTTCMQFWTDNMLSLVDSKLPLCQQVMECVRFWHAALQINHHLEDLDLYHRVNVTAVTDETKPPHLAVTVALLDFGDNSSDSSDVRRFKAKVSLKLELDVVKTFPQFSEDMALQNCETKIVYSTNGEGADKEADVCARIAGTLSERGTAGLTDVFNELVVNC